MSASIDCIHDGPIIHVPISPHIGPQPYKKFQSNDIPKPKKAGGSDDNENENETYKFAPNFSAILHTSPWG